MLLHLLLASLLTNPVSSVRRGNKWALGRTVIGPYSPPYILFKESWEIGRENNISTILTLPTPFSNIKYFVRKWAELQMKVFYLRKSVYFKIFTYN